MLFVHFKQKLGITGTYNFIATFYRQCGERSKEIFSVGEVMFDTGTISILMVVHE